MLTSVSEWFMLLIWFVKCGVCWLCFSYHWNDIIKPCMRYIVCAGCCSQQWRGNHINTEERRETQKVQRASFQEGKLLIHSLPHISGIHKPRLFKMNSQLINVLVLTSILSDVVSGFWLRFHLDMLSNSPHTLCQCVFALLSLYSVDQLSHNHHDWLVMHIKALSFSKNENKAKTQTFQAI